jgi:hypothetical protein
MMEDQQAGMAQVKDIRKIAKKASMKDTGPLLVCIWHQPAYDGPMSLRKDAAGT